MPKKSDNPISESRKTKRIANEQLQKQVMENLIELQKVHTSLAEKFDKLSVQLTSLLNLFEMAARSFAEHPANQVAEKDKEFLEKVDKLLEQNKVIAKGLTLMEERIRERMYGSGARYVNEEQKKEETFTPSISSKPLPRI